MAIIFQDNFSSGVPSAQWALAGVPDWNYRCSINPTVNTDSVTCVAAGGTWNAGATFSVVQDDATTRSAHTQTWGLTQVEGAQCSFQYLAGLPVLYMKERFKLVSRNLNAGNILLLQADGPNFSPDRLFEVTLVHGYDGLDRWVLSVQEGGVNLVNYTSAPVTIDNNFHTLEVLWFNDTAAGKVQFAIDGVIVLTSNPANTSLHGNAQYITFNMLKVAAQSDPQNGVYMTAEMAITDVVIADTAPVVDNGTIAVDATLDGVAVSAQATVNGVTQNTPTSFTVPVGTYTVTCVYQGLSQSQVVTVTANQTVSATFAFVTPVQTGTVSISANVGGVGVNANVTVNGYSGTTPVQFTIPVGTYTVNCTYQGQTQQQTITVSANQYVTVSFTFTPAIQTGTVTVSATGNSVPVAASVSMTGFSGTTPVTWTNVPIGTYTVTATYQGQSQQQTITVTANQTTSVAFAFVVQQTGSVAVSATLDGGAVGANATMAGGFTGTTPVTWTGVPVGTYTVNCTYQGETQTQSVTVTANQISPLSFAFTSAVQTGTVTVNATLDGAPVTASVAVDSSTGATPVSFTLPVGSYTVNCTYQGENLSQAVTITANQTVIVNFAFTSGGGLGLLTINATLDGVPVNASVEVSGQSGTTPVTFTLVAGQHNITATYQGETLTQSATVVANSSTIATIAFITGPRGTVTVNAYLDNVSVNANVKVGTQTGVTPFSIQVEPGSYLVTATFGGATQSQTIVVTTDTVTPVAFYFSGTSPIVWVSIGVAGIASVLTVVLTRKKKRR